MSDLETKWRDKYYDAVAECEALKKAHDENVKLLKDFQELFKDADKEITELRKQCEAMAEAMQKVNKILAEAAEHNCCCGADDYPSYEDVVCYEHQCLSETEHALKSYEKFKEGE